MGVLRRLHRSVCTDRCLLTSAAILGSEIESLSVVAGSMMSTVHCWNPDVPRGKSTREDGSSTIAYVPVQQRLEGHAGAILRVVCRLLEETGELAIATAAEDRSVRTWIIRDWFSTRQFSPGTIARCSTFVGHQGRVYDMVLNSELVLVSVSEDLSVRVWEAGQSTFQIGKSVASFGHQGKSIWCVEELDDSTVVTAGQDGAIHIWHLARNEGVCSRKLKLDYESQREDASASKDFVRVLCNAQHADVAGLVMGTDRGFLYWLSMNEESLGNSVAVSPLELYHAASPIVSIAFEDGRPCLLLIGLANGKAVLFRLRVCSQAASIDASLEFLAHPSRRVTGVFFMESELDAYQLAATSDGTGTVRFWEIFREETELDRAPLQRLELSTPFGASITAMTMSPDGQHVAFGDCQGNISVAENAVSCRAEQSIRTIRRAHGRTVINSIHFATEGETFAIKSVALDSYCREWSIKDLKPLRVNRVSEISLLLSWRNKTRAGSESDLAIGLHGGDLVVWNVVQSREITRLSVGGGSRRPIAVSTRGSDEFRVACISSNFLYITCSSPTSGLASIVRPPFHGREIHAVYLDTDYCGVFSAGEDGQLWFTGIDSRTKSPRFLEPSRKITDVDSMAPVRDMACVCCPNDGFATRKKVILLVGARLTLQAVQLGQSSQGLVGVARVVICPRRMLQSVACLKGDQHRILSIAADPWEERIFILIGTSIGSGIFLSFDTSSCRFQLSSAFNDAASGDPLVYGPMLSCGMIKLPVADSPFEMAWVAFAGGTCGGIGMWKLVANLQAGSHHVLPLGRIDRLVASGVNCTRIAYTHERDLYSLAFGGDDGSIGVVHFRLRGDGVEEVGRAGVEQAHWASTRSIWMSGTRIVSTSGDQTVRLWRMGKDGGELQAVAKYCLDFAEPAALSVAERGNSLVDQRTEPSYMVAVGGHGLSLSSVPSCLFAS